MGSESEDSAPEALQILPHMVDCEQQESEM